MKIPTAQMTEALPRSFAIKRAEHTGITVSSLEDALDFWVNVLGFRHLYTWSFETTKFLEELVGVPGAAMRLSMVEGPGHWIELLEYSGPDKRKIYRPRSCDVGSVHIGFYVSNLDGLLARIAQADWQAVGEVQTVQEGDRKGLRLVYVRDKDGTTLEFLELPEDAPSNTQQN